MESDMSNKMIVTNTEGLRKFLSRTFNKDVGSMDALYIAERMQDFLSPASPTPPPNDLYEGMRLAGSLEKQLELESKLKHTEALLNKALDGFRTSNIVSACMALLAIVLLIAYFMK